MRVLACSLQPILAYPRNVRAPEVLLTVPVGVLPCGPQPKFGTPLRRIVSQQELHPRPQWAGSPAGLAQIQAPQGVPSPAPMSGFACGPAPILAHSSHGSRPTGSPPWFYRRPCTRPCRHTLHRVRAPAHMGIYQRPQSAGSHMVSANVGTPLTRIVPHGELHSGSLWTGSHAGFRWILHTPHTDRAPVTLHAGSARARAQRTKTCQGEGEEGGMSRRGR